ncbi:MAG TPA: response regulator [Acidobacteriota bacterium]|nr:response regulator [Acidobacteriota bacterium]
MIGGSTGPRILIVEDERIVARDFQGRLGGLGFGNSDIAGSGKEALRKVAEAPPDLIFMDIKLKRDMDGIETAFRVRACYDIPVLFMSAMTDPETRGRAASIGRVFYISKPLREKEISEVLRSAGLETLPVMALPP